MVHCTQVATPCVEVQKFRYGNPIKMKNDQKRFTNVFSMSILLGLNHIKFVGVPTVKQMRSDTVTNSLTIFKQFIFVPLRKLEDNTNPFRHQGLWRLTRISIIPVFLDINRSRCWFTYSCKKLNEEKGSHRWTING